MKKTRLLPILFNTEMVRAILNGQKTVTRRIIKPQPDGPLTYCYAGSCKADIGKWHSEGSTRRWTPPCHGDDILYVRETWSLITPEVDGGTGCFMYKADYSGERLDAADGIYRWHPSIHMPKEAARLFLRVKRVGVERLQDISAEGAHREGCDGRCMVHSSGHPDTMADKVGDFSLEKFECLWDSTITPADLSQYGWFANPWVWVIEFERCEAPKEE